MVLFSFAFSYLEEAFFHYVFMLPVFILLTIFFYFLYRRNHIRVTAGFIVGFQLLMYLLTAMLTVTGSRITVRSRSSFVRLGSLR